MKNFAFIHIKFHFVTFYRLPIFINIILNFIFQLFYLVVYDLQIW